MKVLILIIIGCFSITVYGQDRAGSFRFAGISNSASIFDHTARIQVEPFIAWGTAKKQLIVAPSLLVASNIGYQSGAPRLSGLRLGYQFWPGSLDHKWAFFLSSDLRLQRVEDQWNANSFNEVLSIYQDYTYQTVEVLIENQWGYGLTFNLGKRLSLSQGVGLGWYLSSLNSKHVTANAPEIDPVDYRGYGDLGFTWNVKFGMNYQLHN